MLNLPDMERCACGNLRKTTRVITQFYDKSLQSTGLRGTQCALLRNISLHKNITIGELGDLLLMEQSTVTRNIGILKNHGFITITIEKQDARKKVIAITPIGERKLEETIPLWEQAQAQVEQLMEGKFDDFLKTLQSLNRLLK